jgi:hypothetical protein
MPILRGFPPSNTISPSVRITEKDLSFIPAEQSFHRAALVGFCSKGPVNQPTLVSTVNQLHRTFGYPHPDISDPYLIYAAEQYLTVANELYIVRVADMDNVSDEKAEIAAARVKAAGGAIAIQSDTAEMYAFSVDSFFKWSLNGVAASKTLVVLANTYTCAELVASLNDQLDTTVDGISFYCEAITNKIGVQTTWAYGPDSSLELLSVQSDAYAIMGIGTGMAAAYTTGISSKYPDDSYAIDGTWDFTGLTEMNLQIVVDGTDNVLIDNTVQIVDLVNLEGSVVTTLDIVNEINSQILAGTIPGGFD